MPKAPRSKKPKPVALPPLPAGEMFSFTIRGTPRTKKTNQRIAKRKDGTQFIMNGAVPRAWAETAVAQLRSQWHRPGGIDQPVSVQAMIYRDKNVGDASNFYQAIGDALQNAGVLTNDKWIDDWDRSRRRKDPANPRVEIFLSTVALE